MHVPILNLQAISRIPKLVPTLETVKFMNKIKGGLYHRFPKFALFFVPVITFFPLSSVQIIIIPACCLLCVL